VYDTDYDEAILCSCFFDHGIMDHVCILRRRVSNPSCSTTIVAFENVLACNFVTIVFCDVGELAAFCCVLV